MMKLKQKLTKICLTAIVMLSLVIGFATPVHAADIHDVLIGIDAEAIVQKYCSGVADKCVSPTLTPPYLGNDAVKYIFMMVNDKENMSGHESPELCLHADLGDIIRWRAETFSDSNTYKAALYNFSHVDGPKVVSTPIHIKDTICEPSPSWLISPGASMCNIETGIQTGETYESYQWEKLDRNTLQSIVNQSGKETYNFTFRIWDREGTSYGSYYWDPYITVGKDSQC